MALQCNCWLMSKRAPQKELYQSGGVRKVLQKGDFISFEK